MYCFLHVFFDGTKCIVFSLTELNELFLHVFFDGTKCIVFSMFSLTELNVLFSCFL